MNLAMDIGMVVVWIVSLLPYIISIARKPYSMTIRVVWMAVAIVLPILTLIIAMKIFN